MKTTLIVAAALAALAIGSSAQANVRFHYGFYGTPDAAFPQNPAYGCMKWDAATARYVRVC